MCIALFFNKKFTDTTQSIITRKKYKKLPNFLKKITAQFKSMVQNGKLEKSSVHGVRQFAGQSTILFYYRNGTHFCINQFLPICMDISQGGTLPKNFFEIIFRRRCWVSFLRSTIYNFRCYICKGICKVHYQDRWMNWLSVDIYKSSAIHVTYRYRFPNLSTFPAFIRTLVCRILGT